MIKQLAHLATNKLIISELVTVSGYKQSYTTVTSCLGALQPLGAEKTNLYNGVMGKTYRIFLDHGIDIGENDKLRDIETGKEYKVVNGGVNRRTQGSTDYKEVIIIETN